MYLKIFDILSKNTVPGPMVATKASGYLSFLLIFPFYLYLPFKILNQILFILLDKIGYIQDGMAIDLFILLKEVRLSSGTVCLCKVLNL